MFDDPSATKGKTKAVNIQGEKVLNFLGDEVRLCC